MSNNALEIFTIYYNPTDFPKKYVVRRFKVDCKGRPVPDAEPLSVCDTLHEARTAIPDDLYCMPRQEHDVPQIVENWI